MSKINLENLKLFANTDIKDIGRFLIKLINFIFTTIQKLITTNLNINEVDFLIRSKNLTLPKENDQESKSIDNVGKELEKENNDLKSQISDLSIELSGHKNKLSEVSITKDQEITQLKSQIENKDNQIYEFKKILQAIQQRNNKENKNEEKDDIKVI